MEQPTEEKNLPASPKKLQDARRKGQTSQSKDLISGATLLVVVGYMLFIWGWIADLVAELSRLASGYDAVPFAAISPRVMELAARIVLLVSAPLALVILFVTVVSGMAGTLGPVFSFEPLKPDFKRINPAEGLKRIFSAKNVIEFSKGVVKVVVLGAALWLVLRLWLQPLFETPVCGVNCLGPVTLQTMKVLALSAVLIFIIIGFIDVFIQRALFLREMRMTHSEFKREQKDMEGAPLLRAERKRLRQSMALAPRPGVDKATFIAFYGQECFGVRFKRSEVPLPFIVCKGQGEKCEELIAAARARDIPVVESEILVKGLSKKGVVGNIVEPQYFPDIARILVTEKLL